MPHRQYRFYAETSGAGFHEVDAIWASTHAEAVRKAGATFGRQPYAGFPPVGKRVVSVSDHWDAVSEDNVVWLRPAWEARQRSLLRVLTNPVIGVGASLFAGVE